MSNASLLEEATAGAEAMSMCFSLKVRRDRESVGEREREKRRESEKTRE